MTAPTNATPISNAERQNIRISQRA